MKTSHKRARITSRDAAPIPQQAKPKSFMKLGLFALAAFLLASGALWWSWRQDHRPGALYVQQGQAALAAGDAAEAERDWQAGTQADPQFAADFVSLGDLYLDTKRYAEAVREYTAAVRLTPGDGTLFLKLDQADLGVGDITAARAAAREAARLQPDDPDVQGLYGLLEAECDDKTAALPALRRAHTLRPEDPDYVHELVNLELSLQDLPDAGRDITSWEAAHPNDPLGDYLMALVDERKPHTPANLQAAVTYARKARADMPADPRAYALLGQLYLAEGRTQDALQAYQAGTRLEPQSEPMLDGEIECYERLGQSRKASALAAQLASLSTVLQRIEHLNDELESEPSNVTVGLALAEAQEQEHLASDAQNTLVQMVRAAPRDRRTHAALASFYRRMGRPDAARQAADLAEIP